MRILILSDIHKELKSLIDILEHTAHDLAVVLGDMEIKKEILENLNLICVKGNNDSEDFELYKVLEWQGHRLLLTHGHLFDVYANLNKLYFKSIELDCDYILFGHTHQPYFEQVLNKVFINPGTIKNSLGTYCLLEDKEIKFYNMKHQVISKHRIIV